MSFAAPPQPKKLGKYEVRREVGRGGMGIVYEGFDPVIGRRVALKTFINEFFDGTKADNLLTRLRREAQAAGRLSHPNIIAVYDFDEVVVKAADGSEKTTAFIAMEFVEGRSLESYFEANQRFPMRDVERIMSELLDALEYSHKRGVVHRDIKPANIILLDDTVKVADFGVARIESSTLTQAGTVLGSPSYMSPEQFMGQTVDGRSDLYSAGVVLYQLLTAEIPFTGAFTTIMHRVLNDFPPPPSALNVHVPKGYDAILRRAMAKRPDERYQTAGEFKQAILTAETSPMAVAPAASASGTLLRPSAARPALPARHSLRPAVMVTALVCLIAATIGGYWLKTKTATDAAHEPPLDSHPSMSAPDKRPPAATGPLLAGKRIVPLLQSLGIPVNELDGAHNYPEPAIRQLIQGTPRSTTLGSTPEQIRAAFALCRQYSSACQLSWYADEGPRNAILDPFELDSTPVSVRAFRQFVNATHYKTQAESAGFAYAVVDGSLKPVAGGSWRNGVNKRVVADEAAVVGVSFQDAAAYCRFKGQRLPTEDEWEYVARGPKRHTYPWGENIDPIASAPGTPPAVTDGPPGGVGGRYKGLSGNVWQWVDTKSGGRKVLKGGSWLEPNPANKRAATRRYELPSRADEDSGFRCAKSTNDWPDTDLWLAQLK